GWQDARKAHEITHHNNHRIPHIIVAVVWNSTRATKSPEKVSDLSGGAGAARCVSGSLRGTGSWPGGAAALGWALWMNPMDERKLAAPAASARVPLVEVCPACGHAVDGHSCKVYCRNDGCELFGHIIENCAGD
ncbi:MAG: hypothetical protein ACI8TX_001751, partial [Hyphomicrobiaceae bacterium]